MITEDYVSFETARLLKENGFNEKCRALYTVWFDEVEGPKEDETENWNIEPKYFSAPTLQIAMKWLREEYKLFVFISTWLMRENNVQYYFEIREIKTSDFETLYDYSSKELNSVEKACEAAIKYCLENLI